MPFVFLILGIGLLVIAINGSQSQAVTLLKSEFVGSNSFLAWVAAIAILGVLGYVRPIRPVANAFLLLVLLVIVLKNGGGFFGQFNQQLANPTSPTGATGSAGTNYLPGSAAAVNPLSNPDSSGINAANLPLFSGQ